MEYETTALSEAEARAVVGRLDKELIDTFQLTSDHLVPAKVLDALTSHHLLVRGLTDPPTYSFHHHQFLEWFASFKVEESIVSAAAGDEAAQWKLEASFLDVYAFEESVLFACERMSRRDAKGASDVAVAIRTALGIDPMLAAAMVFRSSVDTWSQVRDDVVGFAERWHQPGTVDRAVTFMVSTGRHEFADRIWALIVGAKDDFHIDVARSGRRFRTSVLGPDREGRLRALPDDLKASLLSELVHFGGIEGIELATSVASADQSVKVRASVIEALSFRHARRQLSELLSGASDGVLKLLIDKGFRPADAADINVPRLGELYAERTAGETNVDLRLHRLVVQAETGAADLDRIAEIVESGDFSGQDLRGGSSINEAAALFPSQIKRALLARLSKGLEIPYTAESLLDGNDLLVVDGPTAELVFCKGTPLRTANQAARVVGPPVISRLIDIYLTQHAQVMAMVQPRDQALVDAMYRTQGLVCSTDSDAFASAILARPHTVNLGEIVLLCELVSRHGHEAEKNGLGLSDENRASLTAEIRRWIAVLQAHVGTTRSQLAALTGPIARLPSTDFSVPLLDLLARDLTTRRAEREEFLAALAQDRHMNNSPSMTCWGVAYAKALVAIAGQPVVDAMKGYLKDSGYCGFGSEAAKVLRAIWDQSSDEPRSGRFGFGPDFSGVRDRRARLVNGPTPAVDFVDAILQAVDELLAGAVTEEAATHALDIAATAVLMPYGEQSRRIAQLIELPAPYGGKLRLLSNLTVAGECLSGQKLLALFEAFLEDAKAKPWLLRDNSPQWENWVVLMPFSDQPRVVLEALDRLPKEIINPWQCRAVLKALGYAPANEADEVLIELSRRDPRFMQEHAWRQAFQDRPTLSAASTFLSLLLDETTGRQLLDSDSWALSRWLASAIRRHAALRADVYGVLAKDLPCGARGLLQLAVAEAADNDGVVLLVKLKAESHDVDEHTLHTALERVATRKKPSTEWVGVEEVVGESVQPLRRTLFALAITEGPEATVASKALEIIDTLRDESGEAEGERRHPNIETGVPYPALRT